LIDRPDHQDEPARLASRIDVQSADNQDGDAREPGSIRFKTRRESAGDTGNGVARLRFGGQLANVPRPSTAGGSRGGS
jgi:hypothetical protein